MNWTVNLVFFVICLAVFGVSMYHLIRKRRMSKASKNRENVHHGQDT